MSEHKIGTLIAVENYHDLSFYEQYGYQINGRGKIEVGFYADLTVIDPERFWYISTMILSQMLNELHMKEKDYEAYQ